VEKFVHMTTEAMVEKRWSAPSVEHDRGDLFSTTPDKVDIDKNVLATFFITCDPRVTIDQAGVIIAAEQSVGTFTDVSTATDLSTKTAAKMYSYKYEDPSGSMKHSGWVKVAFPTFLLDMDNRGIPDLFTFVTGNWMGFTPIPNCKWIDFQLPKDVLKLFKGPKFGVEGLREIVGTKKSRRPHVGITIKPKMGVTDQGAAQQFYDAAMGGIDTFKDDETYHNQWCSPLLDRVAKVYEALDKAKSEGAHPEGDYMYAPEVTVDSERTLEVADKMIAHVNVNWISPVKVRTTLIGGEKKMLVWNDLEADEKLKIYDKGVDVKSQEGVYNLLVSYRSGDMWAPQVEQVEALRLELQYFVDCIKKNEKPFNDGRAGLKVVRMLEAANESLAKRGELVYV